MSSRTTHHESRVAIIGGGLTGLTVAWELQKAGVPYTLLEASERLGGKVQTDVVEVDAGRFVLERGADAFLNVQKPWAVELARELGLDDELLPTNDQHRGVYVVKDGALVPLPRGLQLIVPTDEQALRDSPLLSAEGKARLLNEINVDPKLDDEDESVASFVTRRLGDEALSRLAEPLLCGIYNADPNEMSVLATFPRFRQMEREHGSLIRASQQNLTQRRKGAKGARANSVFVSFVNGSDILGRELAARLTGDVRLNAPVERVEQAASGKFVLRLANGSSVSASHVVATTPAFATASLVRELVPEAASAVLDSLRAVSTGALWLAFRRDEVAHPLDGFGVVIPRVEGRPINALTWTTTKFSQRAPDDHVLMRVFFGGTRNPQMMAKADDEIVEIARSELRDLLGINAPPTLTRIYRWRNAQPQYDVGHLDRVEQIETALPESFYVAGSFYRGVGIPDCVRQGKEAAAKIMNKE